MVGVVFYLEPRLIFVLLVSLSWKISICLSIDELIGRGECDPHNEWIISQEI